MSPTFWGDRIYTHTLCMPISNLIDTCMCVYVCLHFHYFQYILLYFEIHLRIFNKMFFVIFNQNNLLVVFLFFLIFYVIGVLIIMFITMKHFCDIMYGQILPLSHECLRRYTDYYQSLNFYIYITSTSLIRLGRTFQSWTCVHLDYLILISDVLTLAIMNVFLVMSLCGLL